uniref:Uncharacterized protein n=1 Tax=Leersia perrieri TaxID=77586 RepID=A0A0D9VLB8_9ORYZ
MPDGGVVIRLPDPRALRVVARSVLLAVALLSLAWLRPTESPSRRGDGDAHALLQARLLLRDLRREGLLAAQTGAPRAVFLGADAGCRRHDDAIRHVTLPELMMAGDQSVDLVLDFGGFKEEGDRVGLVDRVLVDGGIFLAPIGSASAFRLPPNYRVVYVRRFTDTFVGIKKIARVGDDGIGCARLGMAATAAVKEGLISFSAQTADNGRAELKNNFSRKLLLSDIARASAAHAHQGWLKLRDRPVITVDFPAIRSVNELQPAHELIIQDKAVRESSSRSTGA